MGIHLAHAVASALGFDLKKLDNQLFIDAETAFKAMGANVKLDVSDVENPVLFIQTGKTTAEFPVNKNIVTINGKEIELDSVTVQTSERPP
ncbi:hypothetical protein HMPREF3291_01585 [Bacillus sp. HMSC76G11]|nr:hypothetical protein HMPREF3291_01585 [Bacillus sp. HMSC76G11]